MKLSNLAIVFLVLAIMVIMVLTKYISLQIETVTNQANYDSKLIDSTKEAIDAFEINSVQWNSNYSTVSDERRRNIMASINSFTQSFANNLGVGGTSKEYVLSYIPAVAFTLHDGFYIYTPAQEKQTVKDANGVRVIMTEDIINKGDISDDYTYNAVDKGKILYKAEADTLKNGTYIGEGIDKNVDFTLKSENAKDGEYKHVLKPFISYTERAVNGLDSTKVAYVSYSLDNYVTVYYKNTSGKYEKKSGYLTIKVSDVTTNKVTGIKLDGQVVTFENLSERIAFKKSDNTYDTAVYSYIYADDKTKVYFQGSDAFTLNSDLEKVNVGSGTTTKYKEVVIPLTPKTYTKIYQNLATGNWYTVRDDDETKKIDLVDLENDYGITKADKEIDFSAINYCVESYCFTNWFNSLDLEANTVQLKEDGTTQTVESNVSLKVSSTNDPESPDSEFTKHKKAVIKYVIESNLNQAITSYSRNNDGTFKMPRLTDIEWEQIFRNVSIITFAQNIPIGLKYYNNYAIATSTTNKEYVDPEEIYLYDTSETDDNKKEYHKVYCAELTQTDSGNLIGYKNIDFIIKSYTDEYETDTSKQVKYYTMHETNQADYNCLIERKKYTQLDTASTEYAAQKTAYYKALARERYALK